MQPPPLTNDTPTTALEMARRLALILAAIGAVVARRFLRDPQFHGLIVPLWTWLGRSGRRFERAVMRPVEVGPPVAPLARVRAASAARARGVRLPSRRAWLLRALGWEVAGYGCQLEALLAEPGMQAVLANVPAVGRILRPLCRMLGLTVLPPVCKVAAVPKVPKPRRPRVRRAVEEVWEPGRAALREAGRHRSRRKSSHWDG